MRLSTRPLGFWRFRSRNAFTSGGWIRGPTPERITRMEALLLFWPAACAGEGAEMSPFSRTCNKESPWFERGMATTPSPGSGATDRPQTPTQGEGQQIGDG